MTKGDSVRLSCIRAAAAAVTAAAVLAACDAEGSDPPPTPEGPKGELTLLSQGPVPAWDPQRMTDRRSVGLASRTWMRTLTAYPAAPEVAGQREVVGDLATDAGKPSKDLRSWSFTLRKGVTWQDGSPVTCGDVRYGVSRAFAPQIGASGYALTYLDIPKRADGTSTYPGPYDKPSKTAVKRFERAVSCKGATITFRLSEPVATFDEVVSLPEFAPVKKAKDTGKAGADATYAAFSTGPYQLEDAWTPSTGGTWVRNPKWSKDTDPLRAARPERIVHREGLEPQAAISEITDGASRAVMLDPVPSALSELLEDVGDAGSSVRADGQLVDYVATNADAKVFAKPQVRAAFAAATDRQAYVEALGGEVNGAPSWSLLPPVLASSHPPVLDHGPGGDPARAKQLLADAGVTTPVAVRLAYRGGDEAMTAAVEALRSRWAEGGFDVTLDPIEGEYFEQIARREVAEDHDAVWANWGPDYPSAVTVLPPLFDNRINLTSKGVGRDYGLVADKRLNAAMDKAARTRDPKAEAAAWQKIDTDLLQDGTYVPLRQSRLTYLAGREVTDLVGNAAYGGVPDLAAVGVSR